MTRRSTQRQVLRRRRLAWAIALLGAVAVLPVAAQPDPPPNSVCPAGPPKCQYMTIQEALNNAETGDTITVTEPGTYSESGLFRAGIQEITLTSADPGARSSFIIDGGSSDTVIVLGIDWLLQGFTITGGVSSDGGGVVLSGKAKIRNCVIRNNTAVGGGGGGIYSAVGSADLEVKDSEIFQNTARFGGGISIVANLTLINTDVDDNTATRTPAQAAFGGGIVVGGALTIKDSSISLNRVLGTGGTGGGVVGGNTGAPIEIENTTIAENQVLSGRGGGLRFRSGDAVMTGGSVISNQASMTAGGVELASGSTSFVGVIVSRNSAPTDGGGIYCNGGVLDTFSGDLSDNMANDIAGCASQCTHTPPDMGSCDTGQLGVCAVGTRTCGEVGDIGVWGQCTADTPALPSETNCTDGIDEDCDGLIDSLDPDCQHSDGSNDETPEAGSEVDPVNTFSGMLFETFPPDLNLRGPLAVAFSRYYSSGLAALGISGRLGDNWRHNFEWSLVDNTGPTGFVDITSPLGRRIRFELVSDSFELRDLMDRRYQLADTGSTFTLGDPRNGMLYVFDATGKLVSISDGTANTLTLAYTGAELTTVSDGLMRTLTFTYTGGDLTQVSDGTRNLLFTYAGSNLSSFTDARALVTTYSYAAGGLMTSWTLPRGNTPYTQTYDGSGRVLTQTEAPSNTYTFSYDDVTRVTTLTDPAADTRKHTHNPNGELTDVESEDGQSFEMAYNGVGDKLGVTDRFGDSTSITTHEPSGKRASITNADGTTTSYSYSSRTVSGITFYDLGRIDYPDGTFESLFWSNSGNLIARLDREGHSSSFIYNDRGQLESFTNPGGGETTYEYDALDGTRTSRTDPSGNTTDYDYDGLNRLILVTRPDATTRSFTYDNADNLLTVTDERSNTTTFTYDDNGNLTTITDPLTHVTTFGYDDVDRLMTVTDALTNPATLTYDTLGRVATATDREGDTVTFGYDARGRLTSVTDGAAKVWPRGWDAESIPSSASDPLSNTATFTSDQMGRITQIDTPLGNATSYSYDSMGRVTRVIDPVGEITDLSYDPRGLLTDITRGGLTTTIARDELGRMTSVTDPNGQAWLSVWDDQGRLTSRTDPLTNQHTFTYDNRNRVNLVTFPGGLGTLTPTYDGVGNVTRRLYSDATDLNLTYDSDDRLTAAEGLSLAYDANDRLIASNGLTMTRDLNGRLETLTLAADKTVTYGYDARGLLSQVTDWVAGAAGITTFTYDDASRLTQITRPNGVPTTLVYDADSRIVTMTEGALSSSVLTYDAAGKLIRADRTVPTAGDASGATPTAHTYDAASQVTGFTYDTLGRLTADATRIYVWDLASRLTSVTVGGDTVSYTYDALGSRLTRTEAAATRCYVWNYALGLPSVNVERMGGVCGSDLRYYVTTPGGLLLYSREAADDARRDYHYDQIGNTLILTDAAGVVVASYAYDPYGELLASAGAVENLFTWQGQFGVMTETGSTRASDGLYYLRARYYDSGSLRFLSRDPVPTLDPTTVNPYQYAAGAPTRFVDPKGLLPSPEETLANDFARGRDIVGEALGRALEARDAVDAAQANLAASETVLAAAETVVAAGLGGPRDIVGEALGRALEARDAVDAARANLDASETVLAAAETASIQPLSGFTCGLESARATMLKLRERLSRTQSEQKDAEEKLGNLQRSIDHVRRNVSMFAELLRPLDVEETWRLRYEIDRRTRQIWCLEKALEALIEEESAIPELTRGVISLS